MSFKKTLGSDNHAGIHPEMLKAIAEVNVSHSPSYGTGEYSQEVVKLFKLHFGQNAETLFVFNGTAANVVALSSMLNSYNSVLCSDISHLNVDECGAPEKHIGCKLVSVKSVDGKITPDELQKHITRLGDQHFSQVKAVSITQPTEVGTVYSLDELKNIKSFCVKNNLYLHVDGARYILAAQHLGLSLLQLTEAIQPDAISFGGTKNGLMFGEAVIVLNTDLKKDLKYIRKQFMQLPSKMRFIAAQFKKLLEIWPSIAEHEIHMAKYLQSLIEDNENIKIMHPVQANSVFVKIPKAWTKPLKNTQFFYVWDSDEWVMRWMCSFNTEKADIDEFTAKINELTNS